MKIIHQDRKEGKIKFRVETPDDLWHLEKILEKGDLVTSRTLRKKAIKRGKEILEGERKPMTLTINLEDVERQAGILRLRGKIVSGPEDIKLSSYHTLNIEPWSVLTIKKEQGWKQYQLERIKRAMVKQPLLFICILDREQADFAVLKESGVEMKGSVSAKKVKGREDRSDYYRDILSVLEKQKGCQAMVIAGPGFEKENLLEFIDKANPKLAGKLALEYASSTGKTGIQEVIKRSANKILKETRVAKETGLVERLLVEIGKDGKAVYGDKETKSAARMGAVETLLVSEEKVKGFEGLMDQVEKMRGSIVIISSEHESGEKFLGLGGVAGFLRFRTELSKYHFTSI